MAADPDLARPHPRGIVAARDVAASLVGASAGWGAAIVCYGLLWVGREVPAGAEGVLLSFSTLIAVAMLLAWLGALAALAVLRRSPAPMSGVVAGGLLSILAFCTLLGPAAAVSPLLLVSAAAPGMIGGAVHALLSRPADNRV